MTALRHEGAPREVSFRAGLLEWLDAHDVRYEIIDGLLVVSPAPKVRHCRHAVAVAGALLAALPSGLEVFVGDLGVYYDRTAFETSYLLPDVSVVRAGDLDDDEEGLHRVPLLVVEVLSPSTRRADLLLKKDIYRELGVPSYWLVDPVSHVLTVLTLRDGDYVETARGTRLELAEPYAVVVDLG